jgi:hypothetical protein
MRRSLNWSGKPLEYTSSSGGGGGGDGGLAVEESNHQNSEGQRPIGLVMESSDGDDSSEQLEGASVPCIDSSIILSPVSFEHSQLRAKSFAPPPILSLPASQIKRRESATIDLSNAVTSVEGSSAGVEDDNGDATSNSSSSSQSPSPSRSPLTRALFSPQQPTRLIACIRQLKSELDSLRSNLEMYEAALPFPQCIFVTFQQFLGVFATCRAAG